MKKSLNIVFVFLWCFLFIQCSSEKESRQITPKLRLISYQQLSKDTSFVDLVKTNKLITNIVYERLRELGSDDKRERQAKNINKLLSKGNISQTEFGQIYHDLGFKSEEQFLILTKQCYTRRVELNEKYVNFSALSKDFQKNAFFSVIIKGETTQNAGGGICTNCHYNNCTECSGGGGPINNPTTGNGEDEGGGLACLDDCQTIRQSSLGNADFELMAELAIACPGASWGMAELGMCFGPLGAATGGVCTYAICGALAYSRYMNNVRIAEATYSTCIRGCR